VTENTINGLSQQDTGGTFIQALCSSDAGICLCDEHGSIQHIDRISRAITGYDKESANLSGNMVRTFRDLFPRSEAEMLDRLFKGESSSVLLKEEVEGGSTRQVLARSFLMTFPGAPAGSRLVLLNDISGLNGIRECVDAPISGEGMKYSAVREFQAAGILAGAFVHEFNNILTVILGNLSLARMQDSGDDAGVTRLILNMEQAASRMMELTRQLGEYTRAGRPEKKLISVGHMLNNISGLYPYGNGFRVSTDISRDLWPVEADELQAGLVIKSIVENAVEAVSSVGPVNISAQNITVNEDKSGNGMILEKGRYVMITVEDEGPGIPEHVRGRIFEPRFTTRGKGRGTGLALSFAVIKRHRGFIDFDSVEGGGTVFRVYFPAAL